MSAERPLAAFTVAELGAAPPAALCGSHLGALGMRVTAYRPAGSDTLADEWGWDWSKAIHVADPSDAALNEADVIVDATDAGLDRARIRPRRVYCRVLGDIGVPASRMPEVVAQAVTGLIGYVGRQDEDPLIVGTPVVNHACGIAATQAVIAGLLASLRSQRSVAVSVTMVRSALVLMNNNVTSESDPDERIGFTMQPWQAPDLGYRCRDGNIDFIFHLDDDGFHRFCEWLGIATPPWTDPRFDTYSHRQLHPDELRSALEPLLADRTVAETLQQLEACGAVCGPRYRIGQLGDHAQLAHLGIFTTIRVAGSERRVAQVPFQLNGVRPPAAPARVARP